MHDTRHRPDHVALLDIASEQHGYFTARHAAGAGFQSEVLRYHAASGRFIRVRRGLYRLRDYPSSPYDEIAAAWLAVGKEKSVISHETALDLLDLSNVIPNAIHITVPRSRRGLPSIPGVRIHTSARPFSRTDVITRHGLRLTSPTRTILDAAEAGTGPEQIEMAIEQAVERGLILPTELRERTAERGGRVRNLVTRAPSIGSS